MKKNNCKYIRRLTKLACIALGLYANSVFAADVSLQWDWMISGETTSPQTTAFIDNKQEVQQSINALLDVQINYQNMKGLFAIKADDLVSPDTDAELIVSELFWQDSIQFEQYSLDIQLGKVRVDWGVGYGYRPLDIFTPYRRNPIGIQVEEGAGVAAFSYFDMLGEWTLIYTNSALNQQQGNDIEEKSEQQGIGIRRYVLIGDTEYQALAYYDDLRLGLIGGSLVTVVDANWEFHTSATFQKRYLSYQQQTQASVSLVEQEHAYQALVGLTNTDLTGNTWILEYWYDSRAWDARKWDNALNDGSPAYQQGYLHSNIMAHNTMLHWSLDSSAWSQGSWLSDFTPSVDLLYSPEDGGLIATQWLTYLLHDSGESKAEIQIAARFFTGHSDSAYANLPNKNTLLINLKGRF